MSICRKGIALTFKLEHFVERACANGVLSPSEAEHMLHNLSKKIQDLSGQVHRLRDGRASEGPMCLSQWK